MVDEAHITAIAVAPAYRGLGVGELLLMGVIDVASGMGAQYVTLEVRVSNSLAQNLYRKYTFKETGVRQEILQRQQRGCPHHVVRPHRLPRLPQDARGAPEGTG